MKKIIFLSFVMFVVFSSLFATGQMGVGAVVGYPFDGVLFSYKVNEKLDLQLGAGYYMGRVRIRGNEYWGSYSWPVNGFGLDLYGGYEVYRFEFNPENALAITMGGNVDLAIATGYYRSVLFTLGVMATPGISYKLPLKKVDIDLFLRIPLGVNISFFPEGGGTHFGFAGGGEIGAIYRF